MGKKRAPQGLFLRNFTPPHETRSLDRANFCSSEDDFFRCRKFCKNFRKNFMKNFMIFCQKNAPQGLIFLMIFLFKIFPIFSDIFSENFSEIFLGNFLGNFLEIFSRIFRGIFYENFFLKNKSPSRKQRLLHHPTRDASTICSSSLS